MILPAHLFLAWKYGDCFAPGVAHQLVFSYATTPSTALGTRGGGSGPSIVHGSADATYLRVVGTSLVPTKKFSNAATVTVTV